MVRDDRGLLKNFLKGMETRRKRTPPGVLPSLKNFLKGMETDDPYEIADHLRDLKNFLKGMETPSHQ